MNTKTCALRSPAVLLLLSLAFLCGCDGITAIDGVVLADNGDAIHMATVTMRPESESMKGTRTLQTYTDSGGHFSIMRTHRPAAGTFQVTIQKNGWRPVARSYQSSCTAKEEVFILVPVVNTQKNGGDNGRGETTRQ